MKLKGITKEGFQRIAQSIESPTPEEQALMQDLQQWVEKTNQDIMGVEGLDDPFYQKYGEPLADVKVWSPEESKKFSNYPTEKGAVTLVYDGAGFDYLSPYADYPSVSDKYRTELEELSRSHGFMMEDNNSWSSSFWPE